MRNYWPAGEPERQPEKTPKWIMWFLAITFIFVVLSCGLSGNSATESKVQSLRWSMPEEYLK